MYGSSFWSVTRSPRDLRSRPSEDAVRPLPRELETPPVTKMCFVTGSHHTPVASRPWGSRLRVRNLRGHGRVEHAQEAGLVDLRHRQHLDAPQLLLHGGL